MRHPIFAANWKMNQAPADAKAFMKQFMASYPRQQDREVLFFPPALAVSVVVEAVRDRPDIAVGVQNIHWEDAGAFTGENSAPMSRAAGARYVLVGHSERRHVFGETEDQTNKKVLAAFRAGLTPMICVGETLAQREAGETNTVIIRQLRAAVATLAPNEIASCMVAYEPVWAIGTGKTATPGDAAHAHGALRGELKTLTVDRAEAVVILYGGSVNRGNAGVLLAAPQVDGLLVGGASLEADGWSGLVRT
jgi:triosephosphate isomerase